MPTIYLFIYLSIPSFFYSFIFTFIYLFIHPFIHLFNKYTLYKYYKLDPLYLHYFTKWVWGKAGACIELRTLYTKLSSHDMKFRLFVSLSYVFVCVCAFVCLVCLFLLLCISIILSEQVNDFAFSGIFEVEESHKELSICPRHKDDFGTRWLCN